MSDLSYVHGGVSPIKKAKKLYNLTTNECKELPFFRGLNTYYAADIFSVFFVKGV